MTGQPIPEPELEPGAVLRFQAQSGGPQPGPDVPVNEQQFMPYIPPDNAPLWMRERNGYFYLSDELKRAAEAHFKIWEEKRLAKQDPEREQPRDREFGISEYVAFSQEQESWRADQRAKAKAFMQKREQDEHDHAGEDHANHEAHTHDRAQTHEPEPARLESDGEIWQRQRDESRRLELEHLQAERARVPAEPVRIAENVERVAQNVFDTATLKPFRRPAWRMLDRLASFVSDIFDGLFGDKPAAPPRSALAAETKPAPELALEAPLPPPASTPRRSIVDDMLAEARLHQAKQELNNVLEDYKNPHEHEMEMRKKQRGPHNI